MKTDSISRYLQTLNFSKKNINIRMVYKYKILV